MKRNKYGVVVRLCKAENGDWSLAWVKSLKPQIFQGVRPSPVKKATWVHADLKLTYKIWQECSVIIEFTDISAENFQSPNQWLCVAILVLVNLHLHFYIFHWVNTSAHTNFCQRFYASNLVNRMLCLCRENRTWLQETHGRWQIWSRVYQTGITLKRIQDRNGVFLSRLLSSKRMHKPIRSISLLNFFSGSTTFLLCCPIFVVQICL